MSVRVATRIFLAAIFIFAGVVHLAYPTLLLPIMPLGIPFPIACILISGVAELLGGLGLLLPSPAIQLAAGAELILLLIAVFPANVYMASHHIRIHGFPRHDWEAWARLPLQPLLIFLVAWVARPAKEAKP